MNIKLKKFNTLLTLLALLSIGSLFATQFNLGKVTVDETESENTITISQQEPTFGQLYGELTKDSKLGPVLLDKNNNNNNSTDKFTHLYYGNKKLLIGASDTLKSLKIKVNQAITLTTAAPQSKKNTKTNPTNTNNGNDGGDDDKKGLWKNHKYKFIIGGISAGALALAGGAYFMLNSGQESETEKA